MELIEIHEDRLVFQMPEREVGMLRHVLGEYPVMDGVHVGSKAAGGDRIDRELLQEALHERMEENRRRMEAWLGAPDRFRETDDGVELGLSTGETYWLLEVLNDVRVGHWAALGAPDYEALREVRLEGENARALMSMELAGAFETVLLDALEHADDLREGDA